MPRCTVRSSTVKDSGAGGVATSVVLTKPANLAVGDELVFFGTAIDATYSVPTGWGSRTTEGGNPNLAIFTKIANSTDVAASSFTFTLSGSVRYAACLVAVQNPDQTVPIVNSSSNNGTTTSPSTAGFAPGNEVLLLGAVGWYAATNRTVSNFAVANNNPTWSSVNAASDSSGAIGIHVFSGSYAAFTTTGDASATISAAVLGNELALVALQPEIFRVNGMTLASSMGTPTYVRRMVVTALTLASSVGSSVASIVNGTWSNPFGKNEASFTNTTKH